VTDSYTYEAFGNLMASTGTTPNPYRYVGSLGYYQTGNDLVHLGARYYMPEVGRFLQRDLLPVAPPYSYGYDNPLGWVDPQGLSFFSSIKNAARWVWGHVRAPDCAVTVTAAWAGPIKEPGSNRLSNRFRHCMVSCLIATECGVGIAEAAGLAKEFFDYGAGFFSNDFASSAFQPSDFADNATGRACPKGKDCVDHCRDSGLDPWTPEAPPGPWFPYYPHWFWHLD
jgi:RHS repeat-associated protein